MKSVCLSLYFVHIVCAHQQHERVKLRDERDLMLVIYLKGFPEVLE